MDLPSVLLEKLLVPVGSGALSALLAVAKWLNKLSKRIDALTQRIHALELLVKDRHAHYERERDAQLNDVASSMDNIETALAELKKELVVFRDQLEGKVTRSSYQKTMERVAVLEASLDKLEGDQQVLSQAVHTFIREQGEQWQDIQRAMGEVTGYMRGKFSMMSNPPQKK